MSIIVRKTAGESAQLSDIPFVQGGEVAVHSVSKFPGVVVKQYHPQVQQKQSHTLRAKVEAMSSDPTLAGLKLHPGQVLPVWQLCFLAD